jgi:putative ABC transport system substrate-binding protein
MTSMMDRRAFVGGAVSVLAVPLAVEAQSTGRIYWIGDLREGPSRPPKPFADAMRELGWIEGQHFKLERRNADGRDQLPALAAELVRLKVDLMVTGGTPAARAASPRSLSTSGRRRARRRVHEGARPDELARLTRTDAMMVIP